MTTYQGVADLDQAERERQHTLTTATLVEILVARDGLEAAEVAFVWGGPQGGRPC